MPVLKQTRYLDPYVGPWRRKDFEKRIAGMMEEEFSIPKRETAAAVRAAYDAYDAYLADIRATGKQYVEYARANNMPILVVCGRPYHIDPEINHGINDLITSFGFVLVTEDALSHLRAMRAGRFSTSGPSRAVCTTPPATSAPRAICRWSSWCPSAAAPTPSPPTSCAPFWRRAESFTLSSKSTILTTWARSESESAH